MIAQSSRTHQPFVNKSMKLCLVCGLIYDFRLLYCLKRAQHEIALAVFLFLF